MSSRFELFPQTLFSIFQTTTSTQVEPLTVNCERSRAEAPLASTFNWLTTSAFEHLI